MTQVVTLPDGRRCVVARVLPNGEFIAQFLDGSRERVALKSIVDDPPNRELPDLRTKGGPHA